MGMLQTNEESSLTCISKGLASSSVNSAHRSAVPHIATTRLEAKSYLGTSHCCGRDVEFLESCRFGLQVLSTHPTWLSGHGMVRGTRVPRFVLLYSTPPVTVAASSGSVGLKNPQVSAVVNRFIGTGVVRHRRDTHL